MSPNIENTPTTSNPGIHYPPLPAFRPLSSMEDKERLFGRPEFVGAPTREDPGEVRLIGDWEGENIVPVHIPQLAAIPGCHKDGFIRFHRRGVHQLKGLWKAWEDAGLLPLVLSFGGAFNPRLVRGSLDRLSNHSFGTAFDINEDQNQLAKEPAALGKEGCVFRLVPLAHRWGFYWGGHFDRPDGMHFEIARLLPG